jgi:hypothetical protein
MIICKKCGHHNQEQDAFCASCGTFLEWSGERVVEQPPATPPPPPPAPPPPAGLVDRVRQAVGIEGAPARETPPATEERRPAGSPPPPAGAGGWVAPPSAATSLSAQRAVPPAPTPAPATPATPAAPPPPAVTPPPVPPPEVLSARRPEAGAPAAQRPRPAPRTAPVAPQQADPADVICAQCHAGNAAGRHFCRRCGAPLATTIAVRTPWYRLLLPRRQAPAAGDRPVRPSQSGGLGAGLGMFVLTLVAVTAIGGGLAYAALPDFHRAVDGRVDDLVTMVRRQLAPGFVEVRPVSALASSELSGHPGQFAADLVSNDYWAADTARDPQPTLVFTFASRTDLDNLVVTSGAAGDYARLARPRTIQLTYSDGTGEELTLGDDRKPTSYPVHARQVTSVMLRVTGVYPAGGSTAVAIAEVEFYHLR